jgi:two-component system nitrogen regulation response regulator GlnG
VGAHGADADRETLQPAPAPRSARAAPPGLTILFHPDVRRIGEQARLDDLLLGRPVSLSRHEPKFTVCPSGEPTEGLAHPSVSRRPIQLLAAPDGGIALDVNTMVVAVNGVAVAGARVITRAELEQGAVIEVADHIVLLLHQLGPEREGRAGDLGLVGEHGSIQELRDGVLRAADLDIPVLIRGETGTGKELVARAIHDASARARGPFVAVNVAAIPPSTAASELFGHARGAFTGAETAHRGYFEEAVGGTLFLDEIGATPPAVQPLLLRALESLEIQPLGSASSRRVDVRLIAATDEDLEAAISEGSFRAAMLHRLEGYQLLVPPLRERREDIGRLLVHFLRRELAGTGEMHRLLPVDGVEPSWLPASLVARLARLSWPGNVRQLRNVVRQLCISSRGLRRVRVDTWLERLLGSETSVGPSAASAPETSGRAPASLTDDDVRSALRAHEFRVADAAASLGMSRSALYERIRAGQLVRLASDLTRDEIAASRERCGGDLGRMAHDLEVSRRALAARFREVDE